MAGRLREAVEYIRNKKYWIIISLIYLSLIYSVSISFCYGPEHTIANSYFNYPLDHPLKEYYPDLGEYKNVSSLQRNDFWKLSSFWGDCGYYLLQSENLSLSISPYKYRILPTSIALGIHKLTGLPLALSYVLMNILFVYLIGIVFTYFCKRCFGFSNNLSLLGGILAITCVGITRTLPFPMLEAVEYFFFLLLILSLKIKNNYLYFLSSICCVLSKELLIMVGFLYFVNNYSMAKNDKFTFVKTLLFSLIPFIVFSGVRVLLGGAPVEVNYGFNILAGEFPTYGLRLFSISGLVSLSIRIFFFNILAGEFPTYGLRLFSISGLVSLSIRIFLSFSFLWFGLLNIRRDRFLYINTISALPLIIIPTILLSSRISRVNWRFISPNNSSIFILFQKRRSFEGLRG